MNYYLLIFFFFLIAMVYSSVGFGGGSSYLALMGVMMVGMDIMRPAALLCNIVVVTGGSIIFYREGLLDFRKSWPFLAASVPMAFLGGYWPVTESFFFLTLGFSLIAASGALWFQEKFSKEEEPEPGRNNLPVNVLLGGSIGFLSGLVSIGGGIFLSPVLHFIRWDLARKISGLASTFILVNSISGLAGQFARSATFDWALILPLLAAVFVGGQIGSRLGAKTFNPMYIRRITAVLILAAGINIITKYL